VADGVAVVVGGGVVVDGGPAQELRRTRGEKQRANLRANPNVANALRDGGIKVENVSPEKVSA
jgi:hypothetical protein